MIVWDTDVLIDFLRGYLAIPDAIREDRSPVISVITVGEIWHGFQDRSAPLREELRKTFAEMTILPVTLEIALEFGVLRRRLEKQGNRLDDHDLWIAATCLYHELPLFTGNMRHFDRIEGLRLFKRGSGKA